MKKIFFLFSLCVLVHFSHGQLLKKVTDRVKNKVDNNANNKVNNTVDKTVDDAKDPNKNKNGTDSTNNQNTSATDNKAETGPATLKTYSKYDFVPGERIIVFEDFAQDAIGDFPDKWNTNASAEIVTIESLQGKWLKISKQGVFMPEFIDSLPDNFTLEYDLLCDNPGRVWGFYTTLAALSDRNRPEHWQSENSRFTFTVAAYPDGNSTSMIERRKDGVAESSASTGHKTIFRQNKTSSCCYMAPKRKSTCIF
jgi:hypothetical protein